MNVMQCRVHDVISISETPWTTDSEWALDTSRNAIHFTVIFWTYKSNDIICINRILQHSNAFVSMVRRSIMALRFQVICQNQISNPEIYCMAGAGHIIQDLSICYWLPWPGCAAKQKTLQPVERECWAIPRILLSRPGINKHLYLLSGNLCDL